MKAETVKHLFFLECPLYSSPRTNLLSSAARTFADRWSSMSKAQIISVSFSLDHHYCLRGKIMPDLFLHVQSFMSESLRFYKSTLICIFRLQAFLSYPLCFAAALTKNYSMSFFFNVISKWALLMSFFTLRANFVNKMLKQNEQEKKRRREWTHTGMTCTGTKFHLGIMWTLRCREQSLTFPLFLPQSFFPLTRIFLWFSTLPRLFLYIVVDKK